MFFVDRIVRFRQEDDVYPKFDVIRNTIKDAALRIAMCTAEGDERHRLEIVFPLCYVENIEDVCIPASVLRALARQFWIEDGLKSGFIEKTEEEKEYLRLLAEICWNLSLEKLGIPLEQYRWIRESKGLAAGHIEPIPETIWDQLLGRPLQGGMQVEFNGMDLTCVHCSPSRARRIGELIAETEGYEQIMFSFVRRKFIDLNS